MFSGTPLPAELNFSPHMRVRSHAERTSSLLFLAAYRGKALVINHSHGYHTAYATQCIVTGKIYFEVTFLESAANMAHPQVAVGIASDKCKPNPDADSESVSGIGDDEHSYAYAAWAGYAHVCAIVCGYC